MWRKTMTATLLAGAAVLALAGAAQAKTDSLGWPIRSAMNGKCLDVYRANPSNGALIVAWDCNGGANQRWYKSGSTIRSSLNGKCLDIYNRNPNNGASVVVWDCNGGSNQNW